MRTFFKITAAAVGALAAIPAAAAPTITSLAVTGPTGTVWDTTQNSFYTAFIERPGVGGYYNPEDVFSGAPLTNLVAGTYDLNLKGDGFPVATARGNSDPFYNLTITLTEGASTGTISGRYTPGTDVFVPTSSFFQSSSGRYTLEDFSWNRSGSNVVGSYSATNTSFNRTTSPGSGRDYQGALAIGVTAVPEPASWALMILGFGGIGGAMRSRRFRQSAFSVA